MSVSVKSVKYDRFSWVRIDEKYVIVESCHVEVFLEDGRAFDVLFRSGATVDGASIPKAFQWFLPSWDEKNDLYNIAPTIHDALYATKGANGVFTREECDDILRGIWRCSGISRFKAGVADKCVEWFAGGDDHWGNDDLGLTKKVRFIIKEKE